MSMFVCLSVLKINPELMDIPFMKFLYVGHNQRKR